MRHLLLIFFLITLLTSIDGGNIRKLRNALNSASDHELELLEMTMDVDLNGDMDMNMDTDLDEELDLEDPPLGTGPIPNPPNPGLIDSIKQKGSDLWKKGKGFWGKKDEKNGGTTAPGKKEGDKQGILKKWKLKLKKGGANTKAKFCRKFQKRPSHCPPCPRKMKEKSNKNSGGVTTAPPNSQLNPPPPPASPVLLESEIDMDMDMDTSGFPDLLGKFCGPPSCDCPKNRPKKSLLKKIKLKLGKKKNKPTQPNTSGAPPPNPQALPPPPNEQAPPPLPNDMAQAPLPPA